MSATEQALKDVEGLHTAFCATGMNTFEAIEHASHEDAVLAGHLWMRALRMVDILPGSFRRSIWMPKPDLLNLELVHQIVRISYPFRMGAVPVTLGAWSALMGNEHHGDWASKIAPLTADPGNNPNLPAVCVNWSEICGPGGFLERLNRVTAAVRPDGHVFRLPSEKEWEYACRAGTTTTWHFGDEPRELDAYAWHRSNSGSMIHPVGLKAPNPWGLYDMYGNVEERCSEICDSGQEGHPKIQISRGGSCIGYPRGCSSAGWFFYEMDDFSTDLGFRVVLSVPGKKATVTKCAGKKNTWGQGGYVGLPTKR